jgi:D-sedoheptulose 7-phosphate isomerase
MNYTSQYFEEAMRILRQLDQDRIEQMLDLLLEVRHRGGRIFFLGVGGVQLTPLMPSTTLAR